MINALLLLGALAPAIPTPPCWVDGNHVPLAGRLSPLDSVSAPLGSDTITICYGRPSARGRTMVGGIEALGEPWRLGANEATTIALPTNVRSGDLDVPAGRYSIYEVPDSTEWIL